MEHLLSFSRGHASVSLSIKYVRIITLFEFKSRIALNGLILASTFASFCHSINLFASQPHKGKVILSTGTNWTTGSFPKAFSFMNFWSSFGIIPLIWLQQVPQALHLNFGVSGFIWMNIFICLVDFL